VRDLEMKLQQSKSVGCRPFLVVATAGTTVFGAFDNINDVADVCVRHSVWLHVDVSTIAVVHQSLGVHRTVSHKHTHTHIYIQGGVGVPGMTIDNVYIRFRYFRSYQSPAQKFAGVSCSE